jgi:hypothetical protein
MSKLSAVHRLHLVMQIGIIALQKFMRVDE